MARLEFDLDTDVAPERVISALIDFTERRPELWPGLRADAFRVDEIGPSWAVVREGSGGGIWSRERYDWSVAGSVTWTVEDSGFATRGDFFRVDARPGPDGRGSRVHVSWLRRGRTLPGRLVVALIAATRGYPLKRSFRAGFRAIAAYDARHQELP